MSNRAEEDFKQELEAFEREMRGFWWTVQVRAIRDARWVVARLRRITRR
jgi:hypothetical protein